MYENFGKRIIDVLLSGFMLILLVPLLLVLAAAARISSPGPAIFRQRRMGRFGRPFVFYKFRSMPLDTTNVSSDQLGHVKIQPFGRFIRRTSLDELPQLVNIMRGDMSLVGPRPALPEQEELLQLRQTNGAIDCRPGLTGLAQVNSFDGMPVAAKAAFDGQYSNAVTFLGDLRIIFATFAYVLRPPPVY